MNEIEMKHRIEIKLKMQLQETTHKLKKYLAGMNHKKHESTKYIRNVKEGSDTDILKNNERIP